MVDRTELQVDVELTQAGALLSVAGELDLTTLALVADQLSSVISAGARRVIVDLGKVEFMDSSGLRLLIQIKEQADREDWAVEFIRPADAAMGVIRLAGAGRYLPLIDQTRDALFADPGGLTPRGRSPQSASSA